MAELPAVHVRVGDAEREAIDEQLRAAVGAGHLNLAEYEQRVGAVWVASTSAELAALVEDLPTATRDPRRRAAVVGAATAVALVGALAVGSSAMGSVARSLHSRAAAVSSGIGTMGTRTLYVPEGVTTMAIPEGMGTLTVIVPDGYRADTSSLDVTGTVTCPLACSREEPKTVRLVGDRFLGTVVVLARSEAH